MPSTGSKGRTGQGVTIGFGTTSFVGNMYTIGGATETREAIKDSHLGLATGSEETYIPADLHESGEQSIVYEYSASASVKPPIDQDAETITITYPLRSGESSNATKAGTGFLISAKEPDIVVGSTDIMQGEAIIKWDGKTGPTVTPGS